MNLEEKAIDLIKEKVIKDHHADVISAGRTPWDDETVVAVTISYRSRGTQPVEVWEVCFTTDGAWEGHGVYACVARGDVDPEDSSLYAYEPFEYALEITREVI